MKTASSFRKMRPFSPALLALAALILPVKPAEAAFHLWTIREIFTNLDGTQQFIELFTTSPSQEFVSGTQIQVKDQAGTTTHTFTIPSNLPTGTANHAFLIATATLQSAGGPAPDYPTLPSNFLFQGGGTITFIGTNQGTQSYSALPTDGNSRAIPGGAIASNSPQNFAGNVGHVVPEPATWGLIGIGGIGACLLMRRRTA